MKYKSISRFLFFIAAISILFSSCVSHQQLLNFRKTEEFVPITNHNIDNMVRIRIQPDDVLSINVHSLDKMAAEPFNLVSSQFNANISNQNASLLGYLVAPEGYIDFPILGRIEVAGLTTEEAKDTILQLLDPYLENPVVNIRFMNFRITVLGEVTNPATFPITGERMTVLEALGLVGGFTPYSNRDNVLIIREQNGEREFASIDLRSPDIFKSPYFYLRQNDVLYIEPIKAKTATVRDPISEVLPIVSGFISIGALIIAFAR